MLVLSNAQHPKDSSSSSSIRMERIIITIRASSGGGDGGNGIRANIKPSYIPRGTEMHVSTEKEV